MLQALRQIGVQTTAEPRPGSKQFEATASAIAQKVRLSSPAKVSSYVVKFFSSVVAFCHDLFFSVFF